MNIRVKGKYTNASLKKELTIYDRPSTSAQDIICNRTNDTSTDVLYPSNQYVSIKPLSDGSSSILYEGFDKINNRKVLIKKISKREFWRKELMALQKLKTTSDKILKYIDYFESYKFSYIITEFYNGYDLFEHIDINTPYPTKKGLLICLEMAKCLKECHDRNIIHLDIKCENYMVRNKHLFINSVPDIILIDFGHAEIIPENESIEKFKLGFRYGTSYYTCPEGELYGVCSSKSDIWSLGICLSLILTGDFPFTGRKKEYYYNCKNNLIKLTTNLNEKIVDFLKEITNSDPKLRPNINQFIEKITLLYNNC